MKKIIITLGLLALTASFAQGQGNTSNLNIPRIDPSQTQEQKDATVNNAFDAFDTAIAGKYARAINSGETEIALTSEESRNAILEFSGELTADVNIILPDNTKAWAVYNGTTGAFTLTLKTLAGVGLAVPQNARQVVYSDGVNINLVGQPAPPPAPVIIEGGVDGPSDVTLRADSDANGAGMIEFLTANTSRLRINNDGSSTFNGNVGFGADSPADARMVIAGPYPEGMVQKVKTSDGLVDFNFTQRSAPNTGNARTNQVMTWGWNLHQGGGNERAGETGIGLSLESYYHPEGGNPLTEAHLFYINREGVQFRPWSFVADRTTDAGAFSFQVNRLRFYTGTNPNYYAQFTGDEALLRVPTVIYGGLTWRGADGSTQGRFTADGSLVFGDNPTSFPSIRFGAGAPSGYCAPGSLYLRRPDGVTLESLSTCRPGGAWSSVWTSATLSISGISGRLPRFTGATSLGSSLLADNGTNLTLTSGGLLFGATNQDIGTATGSGPRNLYLSGSAVIGGGAVIKKNLSNTATLDFGVIGANSCDQLTITVTGAADGDPVSLGVPSALASLNGVQVSGFVISANTVAVRVCNATAQATTNPPPVSVRASLWQY